MSDSQSLKPGDRLGCYEIICELGKGGMGTVYRARDTHLDRDVALKLLSPRLIGNEEMLNRFRREAKILASLKHPCIAVIHRLEEIDAATFHVLEYVEGETLAACLSRGPLPVGEAMAIARQIATALDGAHHHARPVVHRDLKPGNVMILNGGHVKVLDFGLAIQQPPADSREEAMTRQMALSSPGAVMGTPGYMSPEQCRGLPVDCRADIWAFGCVLYECLAGQPAFPGESSHDRMAAVLSSVPDWLQLPPETPRQVHDLLRQCLRRDPEQRLGDIGHAVRVLEEVALTEGAAQRTTVLAGGDAVPGNLPAPVSSFIGRRGELTAIRQHVNRSRLVTLTGAGGCGKTRLAVEVARHVQQPRAESTFDTEPLDPPVCGVWFIDLAPITDSENLAQHVLETLRDDGAIDDAVSGDALTALARQLRSHSMLLILDNCEHLLSACAELVSALLHECEFLRVLATSRESLGTEGELVFRVPSLSLPGPGEPITQGTLLRYEAIELFVERAAFADPAFLLTDRNAEAVHQICRRLDGIPLAIELAAARAGSLPTSEIARRLDDCFTLLVGGDRAALPRQQTLRATIEWSYNLLSAEDRTLLRRLSIFSGGWTIEAAEAVCSDRPGRPGDPPLPRQDICHLLLALVGKSLVICDRETDEWRYRLQETVAQYARMQLGRIDEGADYREMRRRHVAYFVALAEKGAKDFASHDPSNGPHVFEQEQENFRAAMSMALANDAIAESAMRVAVAMHRYWYQRSALREGKQWLERALERATTAESGLRTRALNAAGILAWRHGDHDDAKEHYEQCLRLVREQGMRDREAATLNNLGLLARDRGDVEMTYRCCEEALAIYEEIGDDRNAAIVRLNLGYEAMKDCDLDRARPLFDAALPALRRSQSSEGVTACLHGMGVVELLQGRLEDAETRLRDALNMKIERDENVNVASSVEWLGYLASRRGQHEQAARLIAAADALSRLGETWIVRYNIPEHEDAVARIRGALGEEQYHRCRAEGEAWVRNGRDLREVLDGPVNIEATPSTLAHHRPVE